MQASKTSNPTGDEGLHDDAAERALLGAVLCDNAVACRVQVRAQDFYARGHGRIWDAMQTLFRDNKPVDHLTLAERLRERGELAKAGGPAYLMTLDTACSTPTAAPEYAKTIRDRAIRRHVVRLSAEMGHLAADPTHEPGELLVRMQRAIAAIEAGTFTFRTLGEIMTSIYTELQAVQDGQREPVIPSGLIGLDNAIGGLQQTLIVYGARTGVGKSAFGGTLAQNIARQFAERGKGEKVGIFSLEDEGEWLGYRYLASACGINSFTLRHRKKSDAQWERIGEGSARFSAYSDSILVDDAPGLSSTEIAMRADAMVVRHNVRVVLVDHNSEIDHSAHRRETREENIAETLKDLRGISKRHKVPVILACQMAEDPKIKAGAFQGAPGFFGAREIIRKARVALELVREPESDVMRVKVLKQTNGIGGSEFDLCFVNGAALIRDVEGAQYELPVDMRAEAALSPPRLRSLPGGARGDGENF